MPESLITAERIFFWLTIYSMIGWVYESILESFRQKKMVNRGFLNGPYLPIYGSGAMLDVLILGWINDPVLLFVSSALLTCTVEYIASYVMEKIYHVRWWDYNDFKFVVRGKEIDVGKFNINGRVCLVGALAFGTLSILLVYFIHPVLVIITNAIPTNYFHIICSAMLALVILDITVTLISLSRFSGKLKELSDNLNGIKNNIIDNVTSTTAYEKANNLYSRFIQSLSAQQLRMFRSFPRLRLLNHEKLTDNIRNFLFKKKSRSDEEYPAKTDESHF